MSVCENARGYTHMVVHTASWCKGHSRWHHTACCRPPSYADIVWLAWNSAVYTPKSVSSARRRASWTVPTVLLALHVQLPKTHTALQKYKQQTPCAITISSISASNATLQRDIQRPRCAAQTPLVCCSKATTLTRHAVPYAATTSLRV